MSSQPPHTWASIFCSSIHFRRPFRSLSGLATGRVGLPPANERVDVHAMLRGQPPLLELRTAKGMTRDQVVSDLREELGLEPAKEQRVAVYYHELETGQLPLAGIRDRVFEAVAKVMGVARASLMLQGPEREAPGATPAVFARAATADAEISLDALAVLPGDPDEVDDLFTGGPG